MDTSIADWVDEEIKQGSQLNNEYERLPSPTFTEGAITEIGIDASKQFEQWTDQATNKVKKIVPCMSGGKKCNWWINVRNPIYKEVLQKIKEASDRHCVPIKVIQIGTGAQTQYRLIKEGHA